MCPAEGCLTVAEPAHNLHPLPSAAPACPCRASRPLPPNPAPSPSSTSARARSSGRSSRAISRRASRSARATCRASCRSPCRRPPCATSWRTSRWPASIYAPHTSAGRLPTELGLRFFVDAMLEIGDLAAEDRARIEAQVRAAATGHTFEGALSRGLVPALRRVARRRRRRHVKRERAPQAYRVRPARADARPRRARRRGRLGREPRCSTCRRACRPRR